MTERISACVRRRPVLAFYVLAFIVTWLGWVPQALHSHGLFPFDSPFLYVFGVGPMVAAFVVLWILRGKDAAEELFGPFLRWRVGVGWYIVALLGYVAIWLTAISISGDGERNSKDRGPCSRSSPSSCSTCSRPSRRRWRGGASPCPGCNLAAALWSPV